MSVLFVSHASKSDAGASTILAWLREWGYDAVFVDHDVAEGLIGGEPWEERLYTELRRCRALIALVDSAWLGSKWCIAEANHAQALRKPVIPIYLEDRKASESFAKLLAANAPPVFARVQSLTTVALEDTKARLKQALSSLGLDAANVFSFKGSRPPYPGLPPFEKDDAPVLFGRDQEITDLLSLLNSCRAANRPRWIQIQGASGSGKSSLLRAGLLPRLERDKDHWIIVPPFRPLADPLRELSQVLLAPLPAPEGAEVAVVAAWAQWIIDAAATVRAGAQRPEATVLLSVDQLEEAVNPSRAGALRDEGGLDRATIFLIALREALARSDHRLLVISTLRADTIGDFQRHRAMRERSSQGDVIRVQACQLDALPKASFFAIIQGPADLAGLRFDDGLVGRIVDETATDDALPLLAFALRELWDRYGKADLRISKDEYDLFGGIEKSVGDRAEAEYRNWMDKLASTGISPVEIEAQNEQFRRLMLTHFAGITDDGRLIRSPVAWVDVPAGLKGVVEAFRDARLMSADQEKVEVAHDALFRRWDRLAEWRKQIGGALADLRLVKRIYAERTDQADLIPEGHQLEQAKRLLTSGLIQSDSPLATFVTSSMKLAEFHEERRRFWKRLGQAASVAVALVGVIATALFLVASDRQRAALAERDRAFSSEATRLAALSRAELAKGNIRGAIELALEALPSTRAESEENSLSLGWLGHVFANRPPPVSKMVEATLMDALIARPVNEPWLIGHQEPIYDVVWSPDGARIATGSTDGTVHIWNTATGMVEKSLEVKKGFRPKLQWSLRGDRLFASSEGMNRGIYMWDMSSGEGVSMMPEGEADYIRIAWSPDATSVVMVTLRGEAKLWDATTGKLKARIEIPRVAIKEVAWSVEGGSLALAVGGEVWIWDADGNRSQVVLRHEDVVSKIAWGPNGMLATVSGRMIRIWNTDKGELAASLPLAGKATAISWNQDGSRLAIGTMDRGGSIWQADTGKVTDLAERVPVEMIAWSPDGTKLATRFYGAAWLWDPASGAKIGPPLAAPEKVAFRTVLRPARPDIPAVPEMKWSPDSKQIAIALGGPVGAFWDVERNERFLLIGHQEAISGLAWKGDSGQLATASADGMVRIWNAGSRSKGMRRKISDNADDVHRIAWERTGGRILASASGSVAIWEASTGATIAVVDAEPAGYAEWDPAGSRIVAALDNRTPGIWDAGSGKLLIRLEGHTDTVNAAAWSPDGLRLVTASNDLTAKIWDATSKLTRELKLSRKIQEAHWSPDGRRIALVAEDGLFMWTPKATQPESQLILRGGVRAVSWSPDGSRLATSEGGWPESDWNDEDKFLKIRSVSRTSWSPDGKRVATVSDDGLGRVWDMETRTEVPLRVPDSDVLEIAWSSNGRWISTASDDSTIRIWDAATGKEISHYVDRRQMMAWDSTGQRLASLRVDGDVEINIMPQENLSTLLTCALGQLPSVSPDVIRGDFFLSPTPQEGSAAAHLSEPYIARYTAAQEACKALLR